MRLQNKTIEIWVGLFLIMGIASIAMLALNVSNSTGVGGDTYRIQARFLNVGGLNEKAPVMVGGVPIGRVASIVIDREDYSAVVEMDIAAHYDNLPIDTGASILTSGLLGAQFVGLEPGAEELFLMDGDEIDITQSAIQLESLVSQFLFGQAGQSGDQSQ